MCSAGTFNLSYKSLSSPAIRQELNKIAQTPFYAEITSGRSEDAPPLPQDADEDDEDRALMDADLDEDYGGDDVSLSTKQVKKRILKASRGRKTDQDAVQLSDSDNDSGVPGYDGIAMVKGKVQLVVPTRKSTRARVANVRYNDPDWLDILQRMRANDICTCLVLA